ncbi:uncharacterized protein [Procambarus clarkii]|uniref:uncharacterized protein n=1 Tax=Procambarus clarkii TaxID=6728 RepID=UPI00374311BB
MGDEILQETDREKDLWVDITLNLSLEAHTKWIASAVYARLANIRTEFRNLCKELFKTLHTIYVRPVPEYVAPVLSPYQVKHKTILEKFQRYATRLVPELRGMNYQERLHELNLTSLEDKKLRGDMITIYQILMGIDTANKDRHYNMVHGSPMSWL